MAGKNPFQGDDVDPFSGVRDEEGGIRKESKVEQVSTPKKETFKEAFASARKSGKDQFTWNGKKYGTELAKPAAKKPTDTRRMGPTKERAADLPPMAKAEAPKPPVAPKPKTEMQRNTAANAKANRERMEERRKAREAKKSGESKPLFGRNPAGKMPEEVRKMAKGGSVRGYGIARGGKKCKMV
jgi:hypothetical protein